MPFEAKDLARLREALCQSLSSPDAIKMTIEAAGLRAYRIRLPDGDIETQWQNTLLHSEAHGTAAMARLLTEAAERAPRLWEDVGPLLTRHGAQRHISQSAPLAHDAEAGASPERVDAEHKHRKL